MRKATATTPLRGQSSIFRRSFALGVVNGILFNLANGFISSTLVLPGLVRRLGGGNLLVGLLPVLDQSGWFLPQLLVGTQIQSRPYKLPLYRSSAVLRGVLLGLLVLAVSLSDQLSPPLALAAMLVLYGLYCLGAGVAGIPFQDVVAKTIPPERRGSYFSLRQIGGGALALLVASPLVAAVLAEGSRWRFPQNYTLLFGLAFGGAVLGLLAFSLVREPPSHEVGQPERLTAGLRHLRTLWRAQPTVRRFTAQRVLIRLGWIAEPFYIIYVTEVLGGPRALIGGYLAAINGVQILSNLLWGRLSDRRGNRLLLQLGSGLSTAAPLLALGLPALGDLLGLPPSRYATLFVLVFAFSALGVAGSSLGGFNYLLEILPERERPAGLGLVNTVSGLAGLLVILGGGLVDWVGYQVLFVLAAGLTAGAFLISLALPEPRNRGAVGRKRAGRRL